MINETINTILSRRSTRVFKKSPIEETKIEAILRAGMSGPSCSDSRDYSFIFIDDSKILKKMSDINGIYARPLAGAACAVLICGDLQRSLPDAKEYFIIDCSIAAQNMILAAESMNIGSLWLGTYPRENRMKGHIELFKLPKHIVPHSIIAFGYKGEDKKPDDKYEKNRIHYNKW